MRKKYWIVTHDCERDTHDAITIGPFADRDAAWAFIDRHGLEKPSEFYGGYAFATVVPPDKNSPYGSPKQWDKEKAESDVSTAEADAEYAMYLETRGLTAETAKGVVKYEEFLAWCEQRRATSGS